MIPKVKKILDLSQPIFHVCPAWPTYAFTNVNYEARYATHGFNAERIEMNSHTGTHLDAPFHFSDAGIPIEKMDMSLFQGRALLVDLRAINTMAISAEHLKPLDNKIKKDDIVLLYTGWAQKRGMNKAYLYEWPYMTQSAAQWMIDHQVKCVCIDGLSVGGWPEGTGAPPHEILLSHGIVIVEELYMDDQLFSESEWFVIVYPIKLEGFGGAPVRAVAFAFE
jgi:arylformamidase